MQSLKKMTLAGAIGMIALAFISCTKERPYKKVTIFDKLSKSGITQGVDHLMMVSNVGVDMEAPAIAYETSQEQLVQFVFSGDSLDVVKVPEDGKFIGNPYNSKLMVSIPVEYFDTKCAEDPFGDCTNVEQIDTDIRDEDKKYFVPKFDQVRTPGLINLSVTMDNYFGGSCHTELNSKLVKDGYKIEPGAVNFVVEKTYRTNRNCAGFLRDLSQVTFTVRRQYSIIQLDKLSTKGYSPLAFDLEERENQFGFFRTYKKSLDESNQDTRDGNIEFQKRFAPGKDVVYYMGKEFTDVDPTSPTLNKKVIEATKHAFRAMNEGLKEANASIRLVLKEHDPKIQAGDLRYNHLIMVSDPIVRGLLGYGPSAADPNTGEIVSARTVMYKGIMKKTIKGAYDDLIKKILGEQEANAAQERVNAAAAQEGVNAEEAARATSVELSATAQAHLQSLLTRNDSADRTPDQLKVVSNYAAVPWEKQIKSELKEHLDQNLIPFTQIREDKQYINTFSREIFHQNQNSIFNQPEKFTEMIEREKEASLISVYSNRNFYSAEVFNTHSVVEQELQQLIAEFGGPKPWKDLSKAQKQKAVDVILPFVWVATLVHELGHNLGLRHNFKGSFDKANFYSQAELAEKGINRPLKYSSIMDYAYGTQNELTIFGKYDVAALRYAYGKANVFVRNEDNSIKTNAEGKALTKEVVGAVELVQPSDDGEGFVPGSEVIVAKASFELEQGLADGMILKPYEFCTDESVGTSSTCNRFDEGTTAVEVVQHYRKAWDEGYERRNLRNNRYDFNSFGGDVGHIRYLMRSMSSLRQSFELYEIIKKENELGDDHEAWINNDFLKDAKAAAEEAGQFLLDIVKTPDLHCMVVNAMNPNRAIIVPLRALSTFNTSCYGEQISRRLPPLFFVVGQAGKSLRSIKDINNPDASVLQIDVRGIWLDKLMALRTLTEKHDSIIEEHHGNFTEMTALRGPIKETLKNVMLDSHVGTLTFDNGRVVQNRAYSLVDNGASRLKAPLHRGLQFFFGLPNHTVTFQRAITGLIKGVAEPFENSEVGIEFYSQFQVYKNNVPTEQEREDSVKLEVGEKVYVAAKSNTVARELIRHIVEIPKVKAAIEAFNKVPEEEFKRAAEKACGHVVPAERQQACIDVQLEDRIADFNTIQEKRLSEIVLSRVFNPNAEPENGADQATQDIYKQDLQILLAEMADQNKPIPYYENVLASLNVTW